MSRSANVHFTKPKLEHLEERIQPSFLLGGAVQQLVQPLNAMVSDMQSAKTDLNTQVTAIKTPAAPPANTFAGAESTLTKAVGDFQRILNDQHAIQTLSNADVAFINAAAFAEFSNGDALDLIILKFGSLIGLNPTAQLMTPLAQANNILNDPTVQTQVNTNFHAINGFIDSTTTIAQDTQAPTAF